MAKTSGRWVTPTPGPLDRLFEPLATLFWFFKLVVVPCDFAIRYRPGRPLFVRGRVARAKVGMMGSFFGHDLRPPGVVTVRGTWIGPNRAGLRLTIGGPVGGAGRQRIRNFLLETLR